MIYKKMPILQKWKRR